MKQLLFLGTALLACVALAADLTYSTYTPQDTDTSVDLVKRQAAAIASMQRALNVVSANFTRPADTTAYASGDLVANSTTAGSVSPLSFTASRVVDAPGMVRRVRIKTSSTSVTSASFRVHFYRTSPTLTNGDNGVWLSTEAGYLGWADVTVDKAFSDGAKGLGAPATGSEINFLPTSGAQTIFALIEARAAYTPTSAGTFTVELELLQN